MKWSYKIGEWAGIRVNLHITFLLLIGFLLISGLALGTDTPAVLGNIGFILALFGCVLLHEFGHALAARRYGISTKDITLLPIGGLARLERMPADPKQELVVALAGPLVNVVIAALLLPVVTLTDVSFVERLFSANLALVAFNLIPAFPMDGGRVLRAGLAMKMDYARATRTAATIGQGFAVLFGIVGFFTNPTLMFIAVFIWLGAAGEANAAQLKSSVSGVTAGRAMQTHFQVLSPLHSVRQVADLMLAGAPQDFPVIDRGRLAGLLLRNDVIRALAERGPEAYVAGIMRRDHPVIEANAALDEAALLLQTSGLRTLPVMMGGQLAGLLTLDRIAEFVMIQSAQDKADRSSGKPMEATY